IKREYSNARTLQQNRVAERKNRTLIKAARTMLADSFLPTTFWAEAVNTACYVLNRVLVTKPQNKTPYEFDGKSDLGFLVRYSLNSKAFRVYNLETKRVEKNLYVNFLENKPNAAGKGHAWMFDLDYLTNSMNYELVLVENQANKSAGPKEANNSAAESLRKEATHDIHNTSTSSTNLINISSTPISTAGPSRAFNDGELSYPDPSKYALLDDPSMPHLEDIYASPSEGIFTDSSYDDESVVTDFNNLETTVNVSPTPTTKIHTIHPKILVHFALKAIGTKWVYRNEKDERGVVVRNKARLVVQGHRQEERIDYDEVFAHVARIEAIRILSAFMYGTIDEEVYVSQYVGFVDLKFPNKKSWCDKFEELMKNRFQMISMGELTFFLGLQTASTPIDTQKPLVKDEEVVDVDVYLYWSMIGSSMYLTTSRPDIMFAVCACSKFWVTPKTSHLQAVKRIFSKELASPKQTALGKDISNLLMAGSHGVYKDVDPHEFTHV
nr:hypothetical protein [Tanacetum cinerariifolium]